MWLGFDFSEYRFDENAMVSFKINLPDWVGGLSLLVLEKGKSVEEAEWKYFRNSQYKAETGE